MLTHGGSTRCGADAPLVGLFAAWPSSRTRASGADQGVRPTAYSTSGIEADTTNETVTSARREYHRLPPTARDRRRPRGMRWLVLWTECRLSLSTEWAPRLLRHRSGKRAETA